jgi:hypothetical protein
MRFEILTAVNMLMLVFCFVTPCGLVSSYERFGRNTASIFRALQPSSQNYAGSKQKSYITTKMFAIQEKAKPDTGIKLGGGQAYDRSSD